VAVFKLASDPSHGANVSAPVAAPQKAPAVAARPVARPASAVRPVSAGLTKAKSAPTEARVPAIAASKTKAAAPQPVPAGAEDDWESF